MDDGTRPPRSGAFCALHPDQGAVGTCPRCGAFVCRACAEGDEAGICPACRARIGTPQGFPLDRDSWTVGAVAELSWRAFQREWLMLSVAALVFVTLTIASAVPGNLVQLLGAGLGVWAKVALIGATMLLQYAVSGVLTLGLFRLVVDVLEGRPADVGRLFGEARKVGRYLMGVLTSGVLMAVPLVPLGLIAVRASRGELPPGAPIGVLLLVVVGISVAGLVYLAIGVSLFPAELAITEVGGVSAVLNCLRLVKGQRLRVLAVQLLAVVAVTVGLLACCVGVLPGIALAQMLVAGVYLALRRGSGLPTGA